MYHFDSAFFLCGECADDRRLDQRYQRHVRVRGNGDRTQQVRRKLAGNVDCRRAVGTTDDADGGSLSEVEVHHPHHRQAERSQQCCEDAKLCSGAEKQGFGVGEQRAKVGQRTNTHENDQWERTGLDAHDVRKVQQTVSGRDLDAGNVAQDSTETDGDQQ